MATLESYNIRSEAAVKRIEKKFIEWGAEFAPLPIMNKDRDALRATQLERIAELLDTVTPDKRLSKAIELVASGNWTKAELESLLLGGD